MDPESSASYAHGAEEWRAVPGLEGRYEVSNLGRVRSLRRLWRNQYGGLNDAVRAEPLILRPQQRSKYLAVALGGRSRGVHGLVLEAFVGPRPAGAHGAHENGDRRDNRLANLAWKTPVENAADKIAHGRVSFGDRNGMRLHPEARAAVSGERNGQARLTTAAVLEIRAALKAGASRGSQARRYGVTRRVISLIGRREAWAHV